MANSILENKAPETNKPDFSKAIAHAQALAAAPVAKAISLSKEELLTLIQDGSVDPAVFSALQALNKGEASKKEEKKNAVKKLVEEMNTHGITMLDLKAGGAQFPDLDKMFDAETIKLVAAPYFAGVKGTSAKKTEGDDTPKDKKPSKLLMIALPANGKRPAGYGKGDPANFSSYTKPAFKDLFIQHGEKFESVMEGYKTSEGKEFYATEEGKKEWAAILLNIKTKNVAPEKNKPAV